MTPQNNHNDPGKAKQEHVRMWSMNLRAIFRAVFGTNISLESKRAQEEALHAIGMMGKEAEELKIVVEEVLPKRTEPLHTVEEALEAIVKDVHQ